MCFIFFSDFWAGVVERYLHQKSEIIPPCHLIADTKEVRNEMSEHLISAYVGEDAPLPLSDVRMFRNVLDPKFWAPDPRPTSLSPPPLPYPGPGHALPSSLGIGLVWAPGPKQLFLNRSLGQGAVCL